MVVLPAEQSHGRTIVGDVALAVFLGVEIYQFVDRQGIT
jgi:hypothetical protein